MVELVDKAFDILEQVADTAPCSLSELSEASGVPLSTAHRIVTALIRRGYLVAERKGRYRLGAVWHIIAENYPLSPLLAEISRRSLADLARVTRAHAHLAVLEGDMVTYLVKQRYGQAEVHSAEQIQLEAYCTAIGKVLLAHLGPHEIEDYLASAPFVRLTPATITDPDQIRTELTLARERGWATEIEETSQGLMCLSAPILDQRGKARAAISVSIVELNPQEDALKERLPFLLETRHRIESKLFPARM